MTRRAALIVVLSVCLAAGLAIACFATNDNGKDPVVTNNADGSISIDRLDPGESVSVDAVVQLPWPDTYWPTGDTCPYCKQTVAPYSDHYVRFETSRGRRWQTCANEFGDLISLKTRGEWVGEMPKVD